MKRLILPLAGLVLAFGGYGLGAATWPDVSTKLTRVLSEEQYVGCEPIKDHQDRMLCGDHVIVGVLAQELIVQVRTSPDATEEMPVSIDCRAWKPVARWLFGPVHTCHVAAG